VTKLRLQPYYLVEGGTIWTAGQIVANFRAQGMAPPPFLYF
jgi:hypothetical protein